jgi:hypothetical protein
MESIVNKRLAPLFIIFYITAFIMFVILVGYFWQKRDKTPEQPINFSHQIHVSKVGLACTHCHTTVEKSPAAGIPSVETCMKCHQAVATEKPEIKKLTKYWEDKKPVPWKRVYLLNARKYVYFSHKRHIKAELECAACHGHVEVMPVIKRVPDLKMGWCMSCHRDRGASIDCATCHK